MKPWPFGHLQPFRYGALHVDCPWQYEMYSDKGHAKSPEAHYPTMSEAELADLPVGHLAAPDCLLFMWSTWPHLEVALRLIRHWGFVYKTGGAWKKTTKTGGPAFGTGYIFRTATEPYLVGTLGAPKIGSRSVRNLIESPRRQHSRKPPESRQTLEKLCPRVPKADLFAREPWPGHDVWGNETGKYGEAA